MVGDQKMIVEVKGYLQRQKLQFSEAEEQYCTKFEVKGGAKKACISVFNTGKLVVGGADSPLKKNLEQLKAALEAGEATPGTLLPFEIEKFPQTIQERVPACDPVIVYFIEEGIRCVKADALLGCAFMLGAASEKAINLLIQSFAEAIKDETNRQKFLSRVNNRMISVRYDEFERSFKSCKSKPTDPVLAQDLETVIGLMFHFCRITRNEVGHPQIVPDLAKGVLLANLGHFVQYIERIYKLIDYFKVNEVVL